MNAKETLDKIINNNIKNFADRYGIFIIFLIFLLTTFGYFYNKSYDNQDFDYLRMSEESVKKIIFNNYGDQLPLWFLIVKAYTLIFGNSEIALKIFSVVIFLLSAFVLYKLCEIYKLNKYLIPALYLFNPLLFIDTAYVFKHWSFLILTSLSALYFFEKFKETGHKKYFIFLIITIATGIYSNLVFLVYLFTLIIYFLVNIILKTIKPEFFIIFLIFLTIFGSPFLFYYSAKAQYQLIDVQGQHMDWGVAPRGFDFIKESLGVIIGTNHLNTFLSALLIGLILLLISFQFFQKIESFYAKLWLISTVFFILIVMMAAASYTPVRYRFFGLGAPLFYLAIFPKSKKFYITLLGIGLLSLTIFSSIQAAKDFQPADWKGAASFLKTKIKDNTQLVMLYKFNIGPFIIDYYLEKPVKRFQNLNNLSVLTADDIWIIRVSGDYQLAYALYNEYNIEKYDNFSSIILIHLNKKRGSLSANRLTFNNPDNYFYRNLKNAKAMIDNTYCNIYKTDSIWPHNEKKPPFLSSKIFERWDCEEDLISKNRIWNTIGKSYAVSNDAFREAIWMHPVVNKIKSLKYENINVYADKITGYYGFNDYAISHNLNTTLTFTIAANGEKIYEDKFVSAKGWKNFEITLNKKLDGVIFSITTTNDRWNHFFFNAFLEK